MNEFKKLPEADVIFNPTQSEELSFHQDDLIQLYPFGLSLSPEGLRPFLLLKDKRGLHTLPVAINPLEAGVTLGQNSRSSAPLTPHKFTTLLMESLDIRPVQCVFVQIKGGHQYVRIYLSGHPGANSFKLRADEAMSLCLHLNVPIFATLNFISESRVMTAEIQGSIQELQKNRNLVVKDHPYLM